MVDKYQSKDIPDSDSKFAPPVVTNTGFFISSLEKQFEAMTMPITAVLNRMAAHGNGIAVPGTMQVSTGVGAGVIPGAAVVPIRTSSCYFCEDVNNPHTQARYPSLERLKANGGGVYQW